MKRVTITFIAIFVIAFIIDQYIKYGFVFLNWGYDGPVISLVLAYNYGVAFSMFSFLEGSLKYIQIAILLGAMIYLYVNKELFRVYHIPIALIAASGISNVLDRFIHGGVVDYVYWHYKFEFAIFNLADVLINIGVVLILYIHYKESKNSKEIKN